MTSRPAKIINARMIAAAPDLARFLQIFLGHDDRFQVSVGGNPNAVDKMLDEAADDFLRIHGDADAANKGKRWLSQPASSRQLELLQIDQMAGFGMTKYAASCHLEWKFNERHIRKMLERTGQRMAA